MMLLTIGVSANGNGTAAAGNSLTPRTADGRLLGDVSQDGQVTIADANMVVNIFLGKYVPEGGSPFGDIMNEVIEKSAGGFTLLTLRSGHATHPVSSNVSVSRTHVQHLNLPAMADFTCSDSSS